jgi:integrase
LRSLALGQSFQLRVGLADLLAHRIERIEHRGDLRATAEFYEFEDYGRLVEAAAKMGTGELLVVRLGGDAGLRRGEMMALRWSDVDFRRKQLRIEQAAFRRSGRVAREENAPQWTVDTPKSGRGRIVPMTTALFDALQAHGHLRGPCVLTRDDGSPVPGHVLRDWLERAQRRAGLRVLGSLHKLRHTFCSHLAMKGAPPKAIQELAGHESLSTTLRYMHLSPSVRDQAIALLNARDPYGNREGGGQQVARIATNSLWS